MISILGTSVLLKQFSAKNLEEIESNISLFCVLICLFACKGSHAQLLILIQFCNEFSPLRQMKKPKS